MKKSILILFMFVAALRVSAQLHFSFVHYTSDNGLSQNSITAMFKDSKGFLWFATRDGLNRFDGTNFKSYNHHFNRSFSATSNRFIEIKEDKNANIWVKAYDEIVYRFNTVAETFERVADNNGNEISDRMKDFFVLPSGTVWLVTYNNGCYKVVDNTKTIRYSVENRNLNSNRIEQIFEDNLQNTWILSRKGLICIDPSQKQNLKFPNKEFLSYTEDEKRIVFGSIGQLYIFDKKNLTFKIVELPVKTGAAKIVASSAGNYIVSTPNYGFLNYNLLKGEITQFNTAQYPQLKTNNIQQIYVDRAGDVWMGIKANGVVKFNVQAKSLEYFATNLTTERTTNPNILFAEDDKDILWIQSHFGLFSWFDRKNNRLEPFKSLYYNDINTFLLYGVNHVLADQQGVLWLSTNRGNGIFKCTFLPDYFRHEIVDKNSVHNVSNEVRAVFEDNKNRLWIATKDGMVSIYDKNRTKTGVLDANGAIRPGAFTSIYVYNIFQDNKGEIWLSTKQSGLYRLIPTANPNKFSVQNFVHDDSNPFSPASNDFYSVTQDRKGRLWAGSYGGGLHYINTNNASVQFFHAHNLLKNYPISTCSKVRQVFADSKNRMWVSTTEGIVNFDANAADITKIKFNHFQNSKRANYGIPANDIHFATEDTEKNIWFATFGGGLAVFKNTKKSFGLEKTDKTNGLPNNIVYTVTDDLQGNLWLTTENSIVKYNKLTKNIDVFGRGNEIENVEFSEAASCLLSTGEICVGSKSGFYIFNPQEVKRRIIDAPIVFTGLKILNKNIEVGENNVLEKQIDFLDEIEFTHKQNVFSIEFATLDMRAPEKIQYAYKLDDFDKDWNYVGSRQNATYTSLSPGSYVLHVKSTDSEGIWLNNERTLRIEILPSFWQSVYAKIIYVLLIIGLFIVALYIYSTIFRLKNNVSMEQQMTDMKLRFFTDISHELRTPLTLISLPVDNILKENIDPFVRDQMNLIRNNVDKVISLINQILDFRKLQNNKMTLNIEEINFGEFVTKCSTNFTEMAAAKKLHMSITNNSGDMCIWGDPERLESILQNLITNAVKYTPNGKNIEISTQIKDDKVQLVVSDEGIGIPQEKISSIFDRFFSNSTLQSIVQKSTGIGLDLVRKMADLHHAEIEVESQQNIGTTFTISFKTGTLHFEDDLNVTIFTKKNTIENQTEEVEMPEDDLKHETTYPLILVVEDNDELRRYLSMSLRSNYRVAEAINGKKALAKIDSIQPDIIIADLRMPEMDGMELTRRIREDQRTSHIPIIILTAVTDMESKMEGMKIGADDYITKPFNSAFLLARIENLLNQRKKLHQYYLMQINTNQQVAESSPIENHKPENAFMQKLVRLMDDNIENYNLNIDMMASEFNMSRTIFFTKLKSLTGLSPIEFIREVRMQRAAEMMRSTELTVSEISFRVGIEDPRYFSRIFKLKFGETPTEYRHNRLTKN